MSAQSNCRLASLLAVALAFCFTAWAQDSQESMLPVSQPLTASQPVTSNSGCNPWKFQALPDQMSFGQYACYEITGLASPGMLLTAGALAGVAQWRNSPRMNPHDADDFAQRFGHIYARQTARASAELLVGYLHHEDPRPRISNEQGAWRRTRAAFLSVLESPDQDGNARMAFAPIAGSLGSGFTTMALYQHQAGYANALERSGFVYSHYFVRALVREFSPELWSLAPPFLRKHH